MEQAAQALILLSKMENCPECGEIAYVSHADWGIKGCNTCEEKVCLNCFNGCRYTCPLAVPPPPTDLERQTSLLNWENAEDHLRAHPDLNEIVIEYIPFNHVYKIARDENDFTVRLHYDRMCTSCDRFFLHEHGTDKFFVCQECMADFLNKY